jgi:hypothetical protein
MRLLVTHDISAYILLLRHFKEIKEIVLRLQRCTLID